MAKQYAPPPLAKPTILPIEGRAKLLKLAERGKALLDEGRPQESRVHVWYSACLEVIKATFGEEPNHDVLFCSAGTGSGIGKQLAARVEVLLALIEELDHKAESGQAAPVSSMGSHEHFWNDIHPTISAVAKGRYESGQFADCVEAALKELNAVIKAHVKKHTGNELDGASLMRTAFTPKSPVIALEDLNTESGRNIQEGYMHLFAGAMIGIRNPKAHANLTIDALRARHFLYLASLLASVYAERV